MLSADEGKYVGKIKREAQKYTTDGFREHRAKERASLKTTLQRLQDN